MAYYILNRRDRSAETHSVFDKMRSLLDRIVNDEDIQTQMSVELTAEIEAVLDEAKRVRY